MDNKRILIATLLCFLLLMTWQYVAEFMGWAPQPTPVSQTETSQPAETDFFNTTPAQPIQPSIPVFEPSEGRQVTVQTPLFTAVFHSGGGILESFTLNDYRAGIAPDAGLLNLIDANAAAVAPMGLLLNGQPTWSNGQWSFSGEDLVLEEGQSGQLTFHGEVDGISLARTLTFEADNYYFSEVIALSALESPQLARLSFTLGVDDLSSSSYDAMSMAWNVSGSQERERSTKTLANEGVLESGNIFWGGVMSNYFLAASIPEPSTTYTFKGRLLENGVWRAAIETQDLPVNPGSTTTLRTGWWFGPKDRDLLNAAPNELGDSVSMGWFSFLSKPLLWLLKFFHSLVDNWGGAIILLTLLIKLLFWPLTRKSYLSMENMKKIQPMMAQLQEKYKDNKEKLSQEMMQLYKTYNINPMGGCLPILIQMPIFIALYQALLNAIELRHATFIPYLPFTDIIWLADLSVKDPLYITPLLMGASMFLQQWMAPAQGDPTQRKMMMLMPVIFTVMFINFPSGLVLYWLCNNIFSIIQQWWTLRKA